MSGWRAIRTVTGKAVHLATSDFDAHMSAGRFWVPLCGQETLGFWHNTQGPITCKRCQRKLRKYIEELLALLGEDTQEPKS